MPINAPLFLGLLLALSPVHAPAQEPPEVAESSIAAAEPLPDPLTLRDAIRLARDDHPVIERYKADRELARAGVELARSRYDLEAHLSLDARTVDKISSPGSQFVDDSRATLSVSKLLYDFGQGRASTAAAQGRADGAGFALDYRRQLQGLEIMQSFLEVRLADLRYFVDDEDMTLAFLRYDRVRERRERFGEFAEVDELELETVFRDRLAARERTAHAQRQARNRLALAMGRPGELVNNVLSPEFPAYDRPLPDYDELLEQVLAGHPLMRMNEVLVQSADHAIAQIEASLRPELTAQFEATEWGLEVGNRDQYLAGLELRVPLGGRGLRNARLAEAMAERERLAADRRALEFELRQDALELVQKLRELELEKEAAGVNEQYRDLYLDRSRTLYQLEVRSDLGDSQARQAEAIWRSAKVEYEGALTWAQIDAMRGMPLAPAKNEESQ